MNPKHPQHPEREESEYDIAAAHPNAPIHQTEETEANPIVDNPTATPYPNDEYVVEEYEQLKRKNRRRLVGAGALVLVAGGLFAAASQNTPPPAPKLAPESQVAAAPEATADILYPNNKSASEAELNIDDSKNAPIRMTPKIQAAGPLSPEEKAALEAKQQRAKAQRLAQQRKAEAERAEKAAENNTDSKTASKDKENNKQRTAADRTKEREDEQRRRKAQALTAKAEAERHAKESATADKARSAQAAADKQRAAERAKLEKQQKNQAKNTEKTKTADNKTANKTAADTNNNKPKNVTVQAGAFTDKARAQRIQAQLKSINYTAHIEEVQTEKGTVYRVRTGKFANENEANNAISRIKSQGMNGVIVGK